MSVEALRIPNSLLHDEVLWRFLGNCGRLPFLLTHISRRVSLPCRLDTSIESFTLFINHACQFSVYWVSTVQRPLRGLLLPCVIDLTTMTVKVMSTFANITPLQPFSLHRVLGPALSKTTR